MVRYSYQLNSFRQWLRDFSQLLQVPVTAGTLTIPRVLGEGTIQSTNLPGGISCVIMNLSLYDDLRLFSQMTAAPGLCLFFNQVKINDLFLVRENTHSTQRGFISLTSTGSEHETTWTRNSRLKAVGLFFPPSFLHRHIRKDILADLNQYAAEHSTSGNGDSLPFEYRQLLDEIFTANPRSPLHHLLLQNRIFLLAEKFLSTFLTRASLAHNDRKNGIKDKEKDMEALKGIVRILSDSQLSKFPSIEALSKTAMMSSTKLKSRFKQTYGMKLYEFYNHHRLEQAREMLQTGNYSVKQVGVNIGFSNLSNFAKAFRKEFGILPKELLKNK